jgi:hypothetical protein
VAVIYFSPRLLCRFDLVVNAISIRRRMEIGGDLLMYYFIFLDAPLAWFQAQSLAGGELPPIGWACPFGA